MPITTVILFIVYIIICLMTGFLATGNGHYSDKLAGILGLIAIIIGIGYIIVFIIWKYWIGIFITFAIYFSMLNIGTAIMRKILSNIYYPRDKFSPPQKTRLIPSQYIDSDEVRTISFKQSLKKSKIMKRIERLSTIKISIHSFEDINNGIKLHEEKEAAYKELFTCMLEMAGYRDIIIFYHISLEELKGISDQISLCGYGYYKQYYIPVALVSLGKPLAYILENKDLILNHSTNEIREIIEKAIRLI